MPIVFKCPKCQCKLSAGDEKAGSKFPCPKCGQRLQVPIPPPPPPLQLTDKTMLGEMVIPLELKTVLGEMEPPPARVELLCPKCRMTFYALAGPPGTEEGCPLCEFKVAIPSVVQPVSALLVQPLMNAPIAQIAPLPAAPPPIPSSHAPPPASAAPSPWATLEDTSIPPPAAGLVPTNIRSGFECPFCHTNSPPRVVSQISTAGWIMFILLLVLLCWPLCWIGLLMKEDKRVCIGCGIKLG